MNTEASFGIYIHWPFCAAKCPYCDFNSHVRHNPVDQDTFVKAYEREISHMASLAPDQTVTSIFFGGGTPSLMEGKTVSRILDAISKQWSIAENVEVSLEANPQSTDATRFADYAKAGVNRVSLGVQSLDDRQLKFLGRLHDAKEARDAIEIARRQFDRISFDMIYARPAQTVQGWEDELKSAIDLAADHLSLYQLTIEEGTPFFDLHHVGKLNPLDEENSALLYEITQKITDEAGLPAYEISNHAKPGSECQHNLVYWRGQDYAGIGPGAHGRLQKERRKLATHTLRKPEDWYEQVMARGHGIEATEVLMHEERADEFLLMGLRLSEGISLSRYKELSGSALSPEKIDFLEKIGMVEHLPDNRLKVTPKGFLVLDAVVADLASEHALN